MEYSIKISKNNSLICNVDNYRYTISTEILYYKQENINSLKINISYKSSLKTRLFVLNPYAGLPPNRIPKCHKKNLDYLINYFETNIIIPQTLNGNLKRKYFNWYN